MGRSMLRTSLRPAWWLAGLIFLLPAAAVHAQSVSRLPANGARNVNVDTHLTLTFPSPPAIGTSGLVRIYDAADHALVDTLDMSIPPSPNPTGRVVRPAGQPELATAPRPTDVSVHAPAYQVTTIAGFDFHFFPIIVRGNTATIYPHNGVLKYGHRYIVKIDPEVLALAGKPAAGFTSDTDWTFTTKAAPPPTDSTRLVVSADGNGDFNTVQGAFDFVPAKPSKRVTVLIKNGDYEELVFLNNKSNLTVRGEDRDKVTVGYPNNSAFNATKDGGPSRRPAFSVVDSTGIQLSNFTINNYFIGQAEALLITGAQNIVDHMTLNGSGDALTLHGSVYVADTKLTGHGDTCLCYGPAFFIRTEIHSTGPFSWTRNSAANHGNVFVDSTFIGVDRPLPWRTGPDASGAVQVKKVFARLPRNRSVTAVSVNFPYAEMVLINSKVQGIAPEGWGPIEEAPEFDHSNVRFWEFNTRGLDGQLVDVSQRHPVSRQLTLADDADTIRNYSTPEFVLGGWKPVLE